MAEKKLVKLMRILLTPFQDVENAGQQLLQRSIETSTGQVLTLLCKLVGQPRGAITDDEILRRYGRARIAVNRSTMDGESILLVARLFLGDGVGVVEVENVGDPGYEITISGVVILDDLAQLFYVDFIRKATGSAIPVNMTTYPAADAGMFEFATTTDGEASSTEGWSDDTNDPTLGGAFASTRG